MAEVTNMCYTCHYILWTLRSQWLSDCSHFHPFKFVDNLTLPAEGEAEGSKIFCTVIIDLVPIKQHISYEKGLLPILVFLVSLFFVKHEFLVLFPSLSFCLTASVAPPLLCPCCWPWAVRCQSLAGGFLYETGCLQGPICGSSPQNQKKCYI